MRGATSTSTRGSSKGRRGGSSARELKGLLLRSSTANGLVSELTPCEGREPNEDVSHRSGSFLVGHVDRIGEGHAEVVDQDPGGHDHPSSTLVDVVVGHGAMSLTVGGRTPKANHAFVRAILRDEGLAPQVASSIDLPSPKFHECLARECAIETRREAARVGRRVEFVPIIERVGDRTTQPRIPV